jgi:hypothetical protein
MCYFFLLSCHISYKCYPWLYLYYGKPKKYEYLNHYRFVFYLCFIFYYWTDIFFPICASKLTVIFVCNYQDIVHIKTTSLVVPNFFLPTPHLFFPIFH